MPIEVEYARDQLRLQFCAPEKTALVHHSRHLATNHNQPDHARHHILLKHIVTDVNAFFGDHHICTNPPIYDASFTYPSAVNQYILYHTCLHPKIPKVVLLHELKSTVIVKIDANGTPTAWKSKNGLREAR